MDWWAPRGARCTRKEEQAEGLVVVGHGDVQLDRWVTEDKKTEVADSWIFS